MPRTSHRSLSTLAKVSRSHHMRHGKAKACARVVALAPNLVSGQPFPLEERTRSCCRLAKIQTKGAVKLQSCRFELVCPCLHQMDFPLLASDGSQQAQSLWHSGNSLAAQAQCRQVQRTACVTTCLSSAQVMQPWSHCLGKTLFLWFKSIYALVSALQRCLLGGPVRCPHCALTVFTGHTGNMPYSYSSALPLLITQHAQLPADTHAPLNRRYTSWQEQS